MNLLFSMVPVVLAANFVNGTLIVVVFSEAASPLLVATWWTLLVVMVVVRGLIWLRLRRRGGSRRRWTMIAIVASGSSGVLWGAAGFLFYAVGNETQRMVLGFVLGGMGAGAVTALTPCLPAFYAYMLPSIVPFCVRLVLEGDTDHLTMGAACGLYLVAMTILGRRANGWLEESILRRFENVELVRSLERRIDERTAELSQANEQLNRDIAERRQAEAALAKYGARQAAIAGFGRLALSGIDLEMLFGRAVALVRDQLEVAGAAVIEEPFDPLHGQPRAAIGLAIIRSEDRAEVGLSDHPQQPLDDDVAGRATERSRVDLARLRDPDTSAEAVIAHLDRPYGMLVAVAAGHRAYSANDISFLQSIANMLAAAIERKRAERNIEKLALRDPLTGLGNRGLFRNHLQQELARTKRSRTALALLLIDLDNFKDVNDTLGHPTGDRLLVAVADRLKTCLRETDAPARLGGDEFALILSDLRSPDDAAAVAQKVVDHLSEPFRLDDHELYLGASIGITVSPTDGTDVDSLLRNADLALYRAKSEGRATHRFYAVDMATHVEARKMLERDLRRALEHDELFLEYQPIFDLATRRPVGVEALLRWRHPNRGVLPPAEFIPVAESTGLIVPVGRWVLERVADQMLDWGGCGLPRLLIAVNISLSQCRHRSLITTIEEIATRTGGDLSWLELEVTEQLFSPALAGDSGATLCRLRDLGVTISMDDFGTGYSSLKRLRHLPVDNLKIDKAFIGETGTCHDADMIVRAIIALAKSLGMTVTGEGVVSESQLRFLIAERCDFAQGYHLSVPLSQDAIAAMLRNEPIASTTVAPNGLRE